MSDPAIRQVGRVRPRTTKRRHPRVERGPPRPAAQILRPWIRRLAASAGARPPQGWVRVRRRRRTGRRLRARRGGDPRHRGRHPHRRFPLYSPSGDYIRMPPRSCFVGLDEYYETLFHELVHWSEHPSRLEQSCKDTANTYIMGELVAQIRACYLALELGVSFSPSADRRSSNRQWSSRLCSPP